MTENSVNRLENEAYLSWVEVNLSAIRHNYRLMLRHLSQGPHLFPVIKADAYGHGAVPVAHLLQAEGAPRLCVARVEEAVELRDNNITTPLLVLSPPLLPQAVIAAQHQLEVVVCDMAHLNAVIHAQTRTGKHIPVHIKTDVGMGRLGVPPEEVLQLLNVCRENNIIVLGIMSHFPCADSSDPSATLAMTETFHHLRHQVDATNPGHQMIFHISNSAGGIRFPRARFDAVRSGIALFGQQPSLEMEHTLPLQPAMNLKTRIIFLKDVPSGTAVSYCQTYHTSRPSRLATLPLGYADGYPRHASNKTEFLLHGKRAPQVGRVCMDQLVIDVTDIPEAAIGDEVLAFGSDSSGVLRAEEVAHRFDSIGYELTTRIGKRLPRFFLDNDKQDTHTNSHDDQ